VVVSDCNIDCDDDAICLKSDTHEVCENISITNCVLKTNCNAIKFGTSSYAGFKNVTVSNCVISKASEDRIRQWHINEPWMGTSDKTVVSGIALESVDGGVMEQIMVSNIVMSDVQTPIFIRLGDRKRSVTKHISRLKNISISNIIAEAESKVACSITGVPGGIVENVLISDVFLTVPGGGSETDLTAEIPEQIKNYPENRMFNAILPASGFYVRHAQNIRFKNIEVKTKNTDARPMFYLEDTSDVEILHSTFNGEEATVKIHSPSSASLLSRPSQTSN
jgi:polygalacturonase